MTDQVINFTSAQNLAAAIINRIKCPLDGLQLNLAPNQRIDRDDAMQDLVLEHKDVIGSIGDAIDQVIQWAKGNENQVGLFIKEDPHTIEKALTSTEQAISKVKIASNWLINAMPTNIRRNIDNWTRQLTSLRESLGFSIA